MGRWLRSAVWVAERWGSAASGAWRLLEWRRAWSALAEHFDQWEDSHSTAPASRLPDGGIDIDDIVRRGARAGRADSCRSAARQLQTHSFALYGNPGPDETDTVGVRMWRELEELRARTQTACF